jgi:molybdenum cofactor cytidylyltransferase
MIFGTCSLDEAVNSVLAHSMATGNRTLKKGHVLTPADITELKSAGYKSVVVARFEPGDIGEDKAAYALANAVTTENLAVDTAFTGRCNLRSQASGVLIVNHDGINSINHNHESMTIATLAPYSVVESKQLVATIKCIPFAINDETLQACLSIANYHEPVLKIAQFQKLSIGFIQTLLSGTGENILEKTTKVLTHRVERLQSHIHDEIRCGHTQAEVAKAVTSLVEKAVDMIVIACASAIVDRKDVIPAGIEQAGGAILHFGMPVDPGNLLLLAEYKNIPVLGMPGCARSIKKNGFDMVLERLVAGIPVTPGDIMQMGIGGLLKEIATRPSPRNSSQEGSIGTDVKETRITAVVLAAGKSTRMGVVNKLLLEIDGCSMVEHVIKALEDSNANEIIVVTGYQDEHIRAALKGHDIRFVFNPEYASGLSTSLVTGLNALGHEVDGVLMCLGDMPRVTADNINQLVDAFNPDAGDEICVPVYQGKRGNPVLWSRRFFSEMSEVHGDVGAKHLIGEYEESVCEVMMAEAGVLIDFDTQQAVKDANHNLTPDDKD